MLSARSDSHVFVQKFPIFQGGEMVSHLAVNHVVLGSNPSSGVFSIDWSSNGKDMWLTPTKSGFDSPPVYDF